MEKQKVEKQSPDQISELTDDQKNELLASITESLIEQKKENENLKKITERASQFNTIWKTATTLVGLVVGIGVATLFFGGVWSDWEQIKTSHRNEDTRSGAVLYDHQKLHQSEIQVFRDALGLPDDFSKFVTESDLPPRVDLTDYLRTGDTIVLHTYGNKGFSVEANTGDGRDKQLFTGLTNPSSIHQVFFVRKAPLR